MNLAAESKRSIQNSFADLDSEVGIPNFIQGLIPGTPYPQWEPSGATKEGIALPGDFQMMPRLLAKTAGKVRL
jgi:hypothetical protein